MNRRTRVMIVDDSAVVRRFLSDLLTRAGFDVMATAPDPLFAIELLKKDQPDVMVLDVEMPRMDGISFLKQLMVNAPMPVVMCSTLTEQGAATTMAALAAGAVGIVTKPKAGLKSFVQDDGNGIVAALKAAARVNVGALSRCPASGAAGNPAGGGRAGMAPAGPAVLAPMISTTERVVAVGVSTGGVQAIEQVLPRLPRNAPGMVIVQHMPEKFTASLATRLDGLCAMQVREARHGDRVLPGVALIAPGGRHTRMVRSGAQYHVEVFDGPVVNHHRPSVDVLFRSVATAAGANAIGLIMTGMGDDGARGLREMRNAGAWTLAQDEASCVVFGMPKEAIKLGAVDEVVPLDHIAERLLVGASRGAFAATSR
jgi:two-component system, chemotaxis family, protein-glutamate methylesterase/glutaminase